jgi:epoxyqueuosine reductase
MSIGISKKNETIQNFVSHIDADVVGVVLLSDYKGTRLEESALKLLPEAKSIIVLGMEIYEEILTLSRPGRWMGAISMNDLMDRNADFLYGRLTKTAYDLAKTCHKYDFKALPLPAAGCPSDARMLEAIFSYKHAGEAAGMGYIGRSSLLIHPKFGPRIRLSCCLTGAELMPTSREITSNCEACNICIKNCPARALTIPKGQEKYSINKYACSIFRSAGGGCAECMRLCPVGK